MLLPNLLQRPQQPGLPLGGDEPADIGRGLIQVPVERCMRCTVVQIYGPWGFQPGAEVEARVSFLDLLHQPCNVPGKQGSDSFFDARELEAKLADFGPGRAAKTPVGDRDLLD